MKEDRFASERARENENRSIDRRRRVPPRDRSFSSGGASVRVQPSLFYVQDRRIEINQIESSRAKMGHGGPNGPEPEWAGHKWPRRHKWARTQMAVPQALASNRNRIEIPALETIWN